MSISVKEKYVPQLSSWTRANRGKKIGCIVNGKLIVVSELNSQLGSHIRIAGFESEEEARRVATAIIRGGSKD